LLIRTQKRVIARAAILLALLATTVPALAEPQLVAAVTGPLAKRLRPGQFLKDNQPLKLGKGDHIVVVDRKGARAFTGPQSVTLNRKPHAAGDQQPIITALMGGKEPIVRLAGVRGLTPKTGGGRSNRLNPYAEVVIPVKPSKTICFFEQSTLILDRGRKRPEVGAISVTGNDVKALATYALGVRLMPWPGNMVPATTTRYRLTGKGIAATILLVPVPATALDWLALGEFLTSRKCSNADWILAKRDWDETHIPKL
jgi:hypothetical protein